MRERGGKKPTFEVAAMSVVNRLHALYALVEEHLEFKGEAIPVVGGLYESNSRLVSS